ncbi:MAG: hypothetical protein ACTHZ9_12350 [Leucobacter sp.]
MKSHERQSPHVNTWVAIAFGALDIRGNSAMDDSYELLVVPTLPGLPMALPPESAALWRRLLGNGVADSELTEGERKIVLEMEDAGVASSDPDHTSRLRSAPTPWLVSPMHELVYALVQSVARQNDIPLFFTKGPVLHRQGLRDREHSGDVDAWVHPDHTGPLVHALKAWGWVAMPDLWEEAGIGHSFTMDPGQGWGCQIDVHRRMPGLTLADADAFLAVSERTMTHAFAGVDAHVPARETAAVLAAVHALRPIVGRQRKPSQYEEARHLLSSIGDAAGPAATSVGAAAVLHKELEDDRFAAHSEGTIPRDWRWRERSNTRRAYLHALWNLTARERFIAVRKLLWPSEAVMQQSQWTEPGRSLNNARIRRLLSPRRGA